MGIVGKNLNIEFVISTGDNFYYDGLKGVDDPAFYKSFVDIYTAPSLQQIWYNGKLKKFHCVFSLHTFPLVEVILFETRLTLSASSNLLRLQTINDTNALFLFFFK